MKKTRPDLQQDKLVIFFFFFADCFVFRFTIQKYKNQDKYNYDFACCFVGVWRRNTE
jgi:hypothetical protein